MGAPDIIKYYKANIFAQAKQWWKPSLSNSWTQIESQALQANPLVLEALLIAPTQYKPLLSPIAATLHTWTSLLSTKWNIPRSLLQNVSLLALQLTTSDLDLYL